MRGSRKKVSAFLHLALCIFFIILITACGDAIYSTSETGSISFSVEWQGAPQESSGRYTAALDCAAAGVSKVEGEVYDENDSYLAGGGPWDCEDHSGAITSVPAGSNRTVVILGKDASGNILFSGVATGISVFAGETTNAGTIVAEPCIPRLLSPPDGSTLTPTFTFEWDSVEGALDYQIQVSTDTGFTPPLIDKTVTTTSFTPPDPLYPRTYYWRVRAEDSYGNKSAWSGVWSFTVSTEPAQVWYTSYDFPETYISEKWGEGYDITSLTYGDGNWAVVMSKGTGYTDQTWATELDFPVDFIDEKWGLGYDITSLAYGVNYGENVWAVVMSEGTGYTDQWWATRYDFPVDFIDEKWGLGYDITSLAYGVNYGENVWAVVMSEGTGYTDQTWATELDFPEDFINEKWGEGYYITNLTYGDGMWAVVMSKGTGYTDQWWATRYDFPVDFIDEKWGLGYDITSLAYGVNYGENVWAVVMSSF